MKFIKTNEITKEKESSLNGNKKELILKINFLVKNNFYLYYIGIDIRS